MRVAGALLLVIIVGCAPAGRTGTVVREASPRLVGEFSIPAGSSFAGFEERFGGISAVAPLDDGRLLALSDDREHSRLYEMRLEIDGSSLRVAPTARVRLRASRGAPRMLDPEGLALLPDGNLLISSEGIGDEEPRLPPAVLEYTRQGEFVRTLPVPSRFAPNEYGPLDRGVRMNAGFESLSITTDHRYLFTANELPLVQDGGDDAFAAGRRVRILRYTRRGETWVPHREFAYELAPLEPVPFVHGFAVNGLVELLALGEEELLALERGFVQSADRTQGMSRVRLFRISAARASDVSGMDGIDRAAIRPVRKTLVADLNELPGLSPSLRNLDNFEALARVQRPGGSPSLLVVSDDNFNPAQATAFLLLALK